MLEAGTSDGLKGGGTLKAPRPDNFTSARPAPFPSPKKIWSSLFLLKTVKLLAFFDFEPKKTVVGSEMLARPWPARRPKRP